MQRYPTGSPGRRPASHWVAGVDPQLLLRSRTLRPEASCDQDEFRFLQYPFIVLTRSRRRQLWCPKLKSPPHLERKTILNMGIWMIPRIHRAIIVTDRARFFVVKHNSIVNPTRRWRNPSTSHPPMVRSTPHTHSRPPLGPFPPFTTRIMGKESGPGGAWSPTGGGRWALLCPPAARHALRATTMPTLSNYFFILMFLVNQVNIPKIYSSQILNWLCNIWPRCIGVNSEFVCIVLLFYFFWKSTAMTIFTLSGSSPSLVTWTPLCAHPVTRIGSWSWFLCPPNWLQSTLCRGADNYIPTSNFFGSVNPNQNNNTVVPGMIFQCIIIILIILLSSSYYYYYYPICIIFY